MLNEMKSACGGLNKMGHPLGQPLLLSGKTVIITILICALTSILLIGCSESINGIDMDRPERNTGDPSSSSGQVVGKTLLWSKDELTIMANGERIVNNEVTYNKGDAKVTNIQITYDGYTNADTSTYVSQVSILGDNENLFIETGEQYINQHHSLNFNISNYNQIRFYTALWCDGWEEYCSSATLKISNLKIYQIN